MVLVCATALSTMYYQSTFRVEVRVRVEPGCGHEVRVRMDICLADATHVVHSRLGGGLRVCISQTSWTWGKRKVWRDGS